MISEKEARKFATLADVDVTNVRRNADGTRSLNVGGQSVTHNNDGGKACWRVNGERYGYIGESIYAALKIELNI